MSTYSNEHGNSNSTTKPPFFILGCVRSGTTMLRDVIASHPLLFCPEETHFFRYAEAFGTRPYVNPFINNLLFKKHRKIDKISDDQFQFEILDGAKTRRELMERYGEAYLRAKKAPKEARWFDKTPQNAYGGFLIAEQFPEAKFIHIVRHPLNVITSLRTSDVMVIKETIPAANYWYESVTMMNALKKAVGDQLLEIRYDEFTNTPDAHLRKIFDFIHEDPSLLKFKTKKIRPEKDKYRTVLAQDDINLAREICGTLASEYGFEF